MAATRVGSLVLPALVFLLPFEPRRPVLPILGLQLTLQFSALFPGLKAAKLRIVEALRHV